MNFLTLRGKPNGYDRAIQPGAEERYQHILLEAVRVFGPDEGARFLTIRNFVLGGRTPAELTLTKEGTRQTPPEARTTRHYSLCGPTMGQPGQIGPIINVCALARVMATRRIFRLR